MSSPTLQDRQNQATSQGHQEEDIHGADNEWKFRAPYRIHSPTGDAKNDPNEKPFIPLYTGACHCGRIQYQLSRKHPLSTKICHCKTCQTLHGAMFQWAAIFEKEDINFVRGHHDLVWYDSGEKTERHKLPCKVRCGYCGTPVMDEGRRMILLFPSLIRFGGVEERRRFDPECHIFYSERLIDIPDGKPKWSGMNDKSELMEEH